MAINYTLSYATQVLTVTDNFDNTETCTIGGKAYTVNATVGTSDGSVHLGDDAEGTLKNLAAAINLDITIGETATTGDYGTSMAINPYVRCTGITATTLTVTALSPGAAGNLIATTETHGEGAWGAAVLAGGAGDIDGWATVLRDEHQHNSEVIQLLEDYILIDGATD
jgi:hypothetical protein